MAMSPPVRLCAAAAVALLPALCAAISAPIFLDEDFPALPSYTLPTAHSLGAETGESGPAPQGAPLGSAASPFAVSAFNISDVRIHKDTFFGKAQAENTDYIKFLDTERLLCVVPSP